MLSELIEKRKVVLQQSEEHKEKRNELNALASAQARERNQLNAQTREFVDEAQKDKDLRDKSNNDVHRLKAERNVFNDKANALFEDIDAFKKEHGAISNNRGIKELQKQIEHLEMEQQTRVMNAEKERELIEKIKQFRLSIREQEDELEQNKEIHTKLQEAREFRKNASDLHAQVTEAAELAQKYHDLMVECYRKADKSREAADEAHKKFVEAQEAADAEHNNFIACQKEIRDYDKVIGGLRKKTKKTKVTKEQKAVRKEAEQVFQQFRSGEKLTTDDILLLQRAKLI
ncbi:MAG: phosphoserine phosphatase [Methanomicrobiaceae archaeon]|nr:phosphoserine phosphatase [Methanomicrobiaceae archaeon]